MFTVCPKCSLMLVVTAADLRAAQGHVRCGRCRSVFNAIESLSEVAPQDNPPRHAETAAPQVAPSEAPEEPLRESAEASAEAPLAESADVEWIEPAPEPEAGSDLDWGPLPEQATETPSGQAEESAQPLDEPQDGGDVLQASEMPLEADAAQALPHDQAQWSHAGPTDAEAPPDTQATPEEPPAEFHLEPAQERRTGAWLAGALVLLLALAGQALNHYRATLATMPSVGPKLLDVYGALGIPVVPRWNVHAYQARQLGATVSGSNAHQITVRASIANHGSWPLPLPLLRVTLQDRYGRLIAARDVPPGDYLPQGADAAAMLAGGARVDATVTFVSPGPQAIGFEIDACLREGSRVVCAHGAQ